MDIDRVLSELKRERKQLDHAIAALESIQRQSSRKRRLVRQTKGGTKSATVHRKTRALESQVEKTAKLIRFPQLRRSGS